MGGDDSQKLLPWRGMTLLSGAQQTSGYSKSTLYLKLMCRVIGTTIGRAVSKLSARSCRWAVLAIVRLQPRVGLQLLAGNVIATNAGAGQPSLHRRYPKAAI